VFPKLCILKMWSNSAKYSNANIKKENSFKIFGQKTTWPHGRKESLTNLITQKQLVWIRAWLHTNVLKNDLLNNYLQYNKGWLLFEKKCLYGDNWRLTEHSLIMV